MADAVVSNFIFDAGVSLSLLLLEYKTLFVSASTTITPNTTLETLREEIILSIFLEKADANK